MLSIQCVHTPCRVALYFPGIDIIEHGEAAYVFHGLKDTATVKKAVAKSSPNSDGHDTTTAVYTNTRQTSL